MAVPKKKTSVRRKGLRRAGHTHKLYAHAATLTCPNCSSLTLKNHICPSCGYHKGRPIVTIKVPKDPETTSDDQNI